MFVRQLYQVRLIDSKSQNYLMMDPETLIDQLIDAKVIVETDSELLELSEEFLRSRKEEHGAETRKHEPETGARSELSVLGSELDSSRTHSTYQTLKTQTELNHTELVRATVAINHLEQPAPRSEGAPDAFLPVHSNQLPAYVNLRHLAIVYVWKDECEPCDLMKNDLNELFKEAPRDIALFAVHGPNGAELLHDRYEVVGAPSVLFMIDGRVDARLTGAQFPNVLENEVEKLREMG